MTDLPTAADLKAEALCWLRYGKRLPAVCTEVRVAHGWLPDVLGCSPDSVVEVEVKISKTDLRRDQNDKKAKFWRYQNLEASGHQYTNRIPNYFYYMVPESLRETALEVVKDGFQRAGVLVYRPQNLLDGRNLEIVKAAQKLHNQKPTASFLHEVFLRTSSELCGTRVALLKLRREVDQMLDRVDEAVVENAGRQGGILDIEDADADLEQRAQDLYVAMNPHISWEEIPEAQRDTWRQGARRLLESSRSAPKEWHEAQHY